jgi:tyrosine-protein phosphatase YwqE
MIDLNTHIELTEDIESDINYFTKIIGALKEQGITECVLSPDTDYISIKDNLEEKYDKIFSSVVSKVNNINLRKGITFKLSALNDFSGSYDKFLINNTNYVNLELSFRSVWGQKYISKIEDFVSVSNSTPIITSIECYPAVHKNPSIVQTLIESDCIISASIESVFHRKNRKLLFQFIERGMIDIFVTNSYYEKISDIKISKALKFLESKFGKEKIKNILQNSAKILKNKELERLYHKPIKKFLWFYV